MKKEILTSADVERYSPSAEFGLSDLQINKRIEQGLNNTVKQKYSKSYLNIFVNNVCTFFNMLGLIGAGLNIKISRQKKFYCAEFVKFILDNSGVDLGLPEVVKPNDFVHVKEANIIYKGKFNEYSS